MFLKLILCKDVTLLLDKDNLKHMYEHGRLKGATVFARLFNIVDDELFAAPSDQTSIDLRPYDVYQTEWLLLFGYLRTGLLPNHSRKKEELRCYNLTLKLGGIPSFDKYYYRDQIYNPMTPYEDVKVHFKWRVVKPHQYISKNESITCTVNSSYNEDEYEEIFYARTKFSSENTT